MTNHPFALKGVDTGKVGNNKYVNYTLKDYERDQDVSRAGALELLGNVKLEGLQPIAPTLKKPETIREKIRSFIGKGPAGTETELVGGKVVGKNRPNNIPNGTGNIKVDKLNPSNETPAFAKAKRGIIIKATYGLIACSIFINKEKS